MPRPRARGVLVDRPTERLEAEVIDLAGRLSVGTYELLVLVGEIDARGSFATWGALTCGPHNRAKEADRRGTR